MNPLHHAEVIAATGYIATNNDILSRMIKCIPVVRKLVLELIIQKLLDKSHKPMRQQ